MAFIILVFLIFMIGYGFSFLRKNNKRKLTPSDSKINSEKKDDASEELFKKIFVTQEYDFDPASPKHTTHKTYSTKPKQEKEEYKETKKTSSEEKENNSKKTEKKELTFAKKKVKGIYSTRGAVRVSGGLLPHHASMGMINFYYDGKKAPSLTGSRGRISIYKTDGNLQVFYKDSNDIKDKEFLGLIVDMYKI